MKGLASATALLVVLSSSACSSSHQSINRALCPTGQATSIALPAPAPKRAHMAFEWSDPYVASPRIRTPYPAAQLDVIVGLTPQVANLDALVRSLSDPCSKQYHHFKTATWLADNVGAPRSAADHVASFLRANGATVSVDPTRSFAEAAMPLTTIAHVFGTAMNTYRLSDGSIAAAPYRVPRLPRELEGIVNFVYGLDSVVHVAPAARATRRSRAPSTCVGANENDFRPDEIASAYGLHPNATGPAVTVAIAETVDVHSDDLARFGHCFGVQVPPLANHDVGIAMQVPEPQAGLSALEASADAEIIAGLAPGIARLDVIVSRTWHSFEDEIRRFAAVLDPRVVGANPPKYFLGELWLL